MSRPLHIFVPHSSEMLTDHKPHGDGLIAYALLTRLAARGHHIYIAAPRTELRNPLPERMHLEVFPDAAGADIASRFRYMAHARRMLRKIRKTQQIDLIHQVNPVFSGVTLGLSGSHLPIVLGTYCARWPNDPGAMSASGGVRGALADLLRDSVSFAQQTQASAILLSSTAALNQVPLAWRIRQRLHIVPYGIDMESFTPAADVDSPARIAAEQANPTVLFVANLYRRKGIFTLIRAVPHILKVLPTCRIKIVGDGGEVQHVRQMALQLGCSASIDFLGWQPPTNTVHFYRDCTVFCMPSLGEPFGLAALEAMSCQRAVVVTSAGGLGAYVPNEGSRKVPVDDEEALAAALVDVITHPEQRIAMGLYNRAYAAQHMDWPRVIDRTEQIYDQVLQRRTT